MIKWLTDSWYRKHPIRWLLLPLSALYRLIISLRKSAYQKGWIMQHKMPVPVIIVGNITVGGTGKTPFVIWLVEQLEAQGYQPGVISRGYGGKAESYPQMVTERSDTKLVGDEPVLIAKRTQVPVAVDPNRSNAARYLINQHQCDLIIADDGLQHYALARDIEIVLVDSERRFGNQHCLPSGPLREPLSRLKQADFIVYHGAESQSNYRMSLTTNQCVNLLAPKRHCPLSDFKNLSVHAVAGIGHPQRFFNLLAQHQIQTQNHAFNDHHAFSKKDIEFADNQPVLMTEKDAVKCHSIASDNCWYVPVRAEIHGALLTHILVQLEESFHG